MASVEESVPGLLYRGRFGRWKLLLAFVLTMALRGSQQTSSISILRPFTPCGPCVCNGTVADCSNRGLGYPAPKGLPDDLIRLSLRNNSIFDLGPRVFARFTSLEWLDLSDNILFENVIPVDAFNGLGRLRELNLSSNWLTLNGDYSAKGPFDSLTSLQRLDLSNNLLEKVEPLLFRALRSTLHWLDLSRNNIIYEGESKWLIQYLDNLTYLDLSHNNLKNLSRGLFKQGLQTLNLSYNSIPPSDEAYPEDTFEDLKDTLIELHVKANCNSSNTTATVHYPDIALSRLYNLQVLQIDGLLHQSFGAGFLNLTSLRTLDLSGKGGGFCYMRSLSNETFKNFANSLRTLNLSLCSISTIDTGTFSPLGVSLRVLDLSYNVGLGFDTLGDAVYGLQGSVLKELYINSIVEPFSLCVKVSEWNTRYFPETSIEFISARNNRLEVFCQGALNNMPNTLSRVDLYGNRLVFGPYFKDFVNLVGLTDLEVDGHAFAFHPPVRYPAEDTGECEASDGEMSQCRLGWRPYGDHIWVDQEHTDMNEQTESWNLQEFMKTEGLTFRLPPNLMTFKSRWNELFYRLEGIRFDPNNSLVSLNFRSNLLTTWTGPVSGLDKLESLTLQNNLAFRFKTSFFKDFRSVKKLYLSKNYLNVVLSDDEEGLLFGPLDKLEYLDISRNYLYTLPRQVFKGLVSLRFLNLSRNFIAFFGVNITHMANLSMIDLSSNKIKYLSYEIMSHLDTIAERIEVHLDLTMNPLACTCEQMDFLRWVQQSEVVLPSSERYICLMSSGNYERKTDIFKVIGQLESSCMDKFGIFVGAASCAFCLLVAMLSALVYRYRWKLRYLYYASRLAYRRLQTCDNDNDDFEFDAFVSYSSEDNDFVHGELLEELETWAGLRLNVHNRDFIPGRPIPSNIVSAVQSSRRTLVVLSRELVQSEWCHYEMQMATMEAAHTGRDVLLFLLYEDVPSQQLPRDVLYNLQSSTYITFPGTRAEPSLVRDFWARLAQAIRL
ncbi:toll-like receptor 4 [Littorina saxatilis]|uniref:TIR domain-containing protein n=1 Tax=Littorina saxatilis TaxID=31220 RepID=A0AAN9GLI6_9CAEN